MAYHCEKCRDIGYVPLDGGRADICDCPAATGMISVKRVSKPEVDTSLQEKLNYYRVRWDQVLEADKANIEAELAGTPRPPPADKSLRERICNCLALSPDASNDQILSRLQGERQAHGNLGVEFDRFVNSLIRELGMPAVGPHDMLGEVKRLYAIYLALVHSGEFGVPGEAPCVSPERVKARFEELRALRGYVAALPKSRPADDYALVAQIAGRLWRDGDRTMEEAVDLARQIVALAKKGV